MNLCEYGCGRKGRYQFKNGKWCCSKTTTKCSYIRSINSLKNKGRIKSEEEKKNISNSKKGKSRPLFTKEWKQNISKSVKGRVPWNKGLTKFDDERIAKQASCGMKGKKHTSEWVKNHIERMQNFKHSDESKLKQSLIRKNKKLSIGENNPMFGKTHNELSKQIMREKKIGLYDGKNNPNWKGGLSKEPYCFEFTNDLKDYIKYRDNYLCQNPHCNKTSNQLCVHHIDYNKKHCETINLITLCLSCNSRANFKRDYWKALYSIFLVERKRIREGV